MMECTSALAPTLMLDRTSPSLSPSQYRSKVSQTVVSHISIEHALIAPVPPVVDLTANQLVVGEGMILILTCNVTRSNPKTYTYVWTHVISAEILTETTNTLTLSGFTTSDMGMYRCEVTNAAGTGMDSITIELGGQALKLDSRLVLSTQTHGGWGGGESIGTRD